MLPEIKSYTTCISLRYLIHCKWILSLFVENPWLKHMVLKQCGHITFPFQHQLVNEMLPSVVSKTREKYMSFLLLFHVLFVQPHLIFRYHMLGMTFLAWWLVSSMMCGSPFMLIWVFLKCTTLSMQTW